MANAVVVNCRPIRGADCGRSAVTGWMHLLFKQLMSNKAAAMCLQKAGKPMLILVIAGTEKQVVPVSNNTESKASSGADLFFCVKLRDLTPVERQITAGTCLRYSGRAGVIPNLLWERRQKW